MRRIEYVGVRGSLGRSERSVREQEVEVRKDSGDRHPD
jgi:hypothetical protein